MPEEIKKAQDFLKSINLSYGKLINTNEKIHAVEKFNESILCLENRFLSLLEVEKEIFSVEFNSSKCMKRSMSEIQLDLVNKTEGFFQQLYTCSSSFILLLNHIAPHSFKRGMPIRQVKEFFEFLSTRFPSLKESLAWLEKARDFRARFVDHPQQHALHDWMTYSYPSKISREQEYVIIYFIRDGSGVYYRGTNPNPYACDFQPPIDCKIFYVSPPHKECLLALQVVVEYIINDLAKTV